MEGEDFDDIIDSLPAHLRNKVLEEGFDGPVEMLPAKAGCLEKVLWWFLLPVVWIWAAVVGTIAIPFIVIPPVGIFLFVLAGYPGAVHAAWYLTRLKSLPSEVIPENPQIDR